MQIVPATLYERNVFKINIWKKICFQSIKLNETNVYFRPEYYFLKPEHTVRSKRCYRISNMYFLKKFRTLNWHCGSWNNLKLLYFDRYQTLVSMCLSASNRIRKVFKDYFFLTIVFSLTFSLSATYRHVSNWRAFPSRAEKLATTTAAKYWHKIFLLKHSLRLWM